MTIKIWWNNILIEIANCWCNFAHLHNISFVHILIQNYLRCDPLETTDWPSRGALPASSVSCHGMAHPDLAYPVECSHRMICLPVLCHGMPYPDIACHIEWSQCERKIFHGERFTCKFFHCMPHPDLACHTECSNHEIFNCQFSVMACHTLTLPVLLSAASWLPMKNRLFMTTYIWNLPAKGREHFYSVK